MDEGIEGASDKKNSSVRKVLLREKSWSCRQFVVLLFSLGACTLAYLDPEFRPTFGNLVNLSVGGYLGQLIPKKKE